MLHCIREGLMPLVKEMFQGPVEVDETYVGGKESNKYASKKLNAERGPVGKTAVVAAKDRATGKVIAQTVSFTNKVTPGSSDQWHFRSELPA